MGRPTIAYLNEWRAIRRETGIRKSKWKAPNRAPPEPVKPGERISRSYALLLAVRYHRRRQAEIAQAKHLASLGDYEIPF
jgi:hypothetical protein